MPWTEIPELKAAGGHTAARPWQLGRRTGLWERTRGTSGIPWSNRLLAQAGDARARQLLQPRSRAKRSSRARLCCGLSLSKLGDSHGRAALTEPGAAGSQLAPEPHQLLAALGEPDRAGSAGRKPVGRRRPGEPKERAGDYGAGGLWPRDAVVMLAGNYRASGTTGMTPSASPPPEPYCGLWRPVSGLLPAQRDPELEPRRRSLRRQCDNSWKAGDRPRLGELNSDETIPPLDCSAALIVQREVPSDRRRGR